MVHRLIMDNHIDIQTANYHHALVVEDLPVINQWLTDMLYQAFPAITIQAASTLAQARTLIGRKTPFQLALIDLGLPDGSGVELIRELASAQPQALIIVVTIYDDDEHLFTALAAGAQGYILKDHPSEVFQQHLQQLQLGIPALSPSIARRMLAYFRRSDMAAEPQTFTALTPRETEVLSCIGRGMRISQAAKTLHISEHTASGYVKDIYRKLNISSRAEAALEADRRGLT